MVYFTLKLDLSKCDYAEIVALSDPHYGGGNDRPLIRRTLEYVAQRNAEGIPCLCIPMGDNVDNGHKYAEGGEISPERSASELRQDFDRYVKAGWIPGFIEGNHDNRNSRKLRSTLDLTRMQVDAWNQQYGLKMFYEPCMVLILKFNKWHSTSLFFHHGRVKNPEQLLGMVCNPDIVVTGDRHRARHTTYGTYVLSKRTATLTKKEVHFVEVASNQYDTKYAIRNGLRPTVRSNTIIQLTPPPETNHKRRLKVTLDSISEVW